MLSKKYIRIQARYTGRTGKPCGVFAANWHLLYADRFSPEDKELFLETEKWFREKLPVPPFYDKDNPEKNNPQKATTWFKTEAIDKYEEQILVLTGLLEKHDVDYDVVYTDFVGEIIYEDDDQVAVIERES